MGQVFSVAQRQSVDLGALWVGTNGSLFNGRRVDHLNGGNEREHDDGLEGYHGDSRGVGARRGKEAMSEYKASFSNVTRMLTVSC